MEPLLPNHFVEHVVEFYRIFMIVVVDCYERDQQEVRTGKLSCRAEENYAFFELTFPPQRGRPVAYRVRVELTDKTRFAEKLICPGALQTQLSVPCGKDGRVLTVRLHRLDSTDVTNPWADLRFELDARIRKIGEWTPPKKIEEQIPAQVLAGSSV